MSSLLNGVSSTTTDVGTVYGQILVSNAQGFSVNGTVLISSKMFPEAQQLIITAIQGNQLTLKTLQNTMADLSFYRPLPIDTVTVTQLSTQVASYGLFTGNASANTLYGYFNKVTGPDTGVASEIGQQFWCLNAVNTNDSIIWICLTPGVNAPQWAAGQTIQVNMQRSNAGNNYVAASAGTTTGGNAPTGTATQTGSDGITWIYVNSLPISTFSSILLNGTGGAAPTFASNEIPLPTPTDGINNAFTLLNTPLNGQINVYLSGLRVPPTNYVLVGKTFTFISGQTPPINSALYVDYFY